MTHRPARIALAVCLTGLMGLVAVVNLAAAEKDEKGEKDADCCQAKMTPQIQADIRALAPIQHFVGGWRGTGWPRRGSRTIWGEKGDWEYEFIDDRAVLAFESTEGRFFKYADIRPAKEAGKFVLTASPRESEEQITFTGAVTEEGELIVENPKAGPDDLRRVRIRLIAHGDRMVIEYEKRKRPDAPYVQTGFVAMTRKGSGFGKGGANLRACVVTGGHSEGSITYEGKSYYICCTGCRNIFNDDPLGVLADWERRKKEDAAAQKKED